MTRGGLFHTLPPLAANPTTGRGAGTRAAAEERDIRRIAACQDTGGGFKCASWSGRVCLKAGERTIRDDRCRKGRAETGLGGTLAGDPDGTCWRMAAGKALK